MKFLALIPLFILLSCGADDNEPVAADEFTNNEVVYNLYSASEFGISGTATFRELATGGLDVSIQLLNTTGNIFHPVHLHAGSVRDDGPLVSVLNPVYGDSGESNSKVTFLMSDENSSFTYSDLLKFDGSLRIHLDGGPGQNILVAAANIGNNDNLISDGIAICNQW
jgi:hypothetical protein